MSGADWQEIVCVTVAVAACGYVVWFLFRGGE